MSADDPPALLQQLLADANVAADPIAVELAHVVSVPTGTTSAGHPYLEDAAYARFRDRVPHILAMGPRALAALDTVLAAAPSSSSLQDAAKVVRGCILTAAITAPPDLWLVRHVAGNLARAHVIERLLAGEAIDAASCVVDGRRADARELDADLTLLLSRGLVDVDGAGRFTAPAHARARETLAALGPVPAWPADISRLWLRAFRDETLSPHERDVLVDVGAGATARVDARQDTWIPTFAEVDAGFRLVPVVLALRAAGLHARIARGERVDAGTFGAYANVGAAALAVLRAGGVVDDGGVPTATGRRVGEKGAGPMGIIEAYHPYMAALDRILVDGRTPSGGAWVTRGANIAASQDANRESFQKANAALDAFCERTGFRYTVFIEHAIGRGEATRQRFEKSGDALRYFGADLEDAAIDACVEEQRAGRLPKNMVFVRHADIGDPRLLVEAIRASGASTEGAVMIVGNGFHEVRGRDDDGMTDVFRAYCEAGIVLLFTEENALRIDDLLATAWNTYHAGFRYVHAKSGQALRPAEPSPPSKIGPPLRRSWRECAERAGYVHVDAYSSKSRTVYPLAPKDRGRNPNISGNHFCVPARLMIPRTS